MAVAILHGLVEYHETGHLGGLFEGAQILPVQLYIVPILVAAFWYGLRGGLMTGLLTLTLSVPNLMLWHRGDFAWLGETMANLVVLAIGLFVGLAGERALAAREAASVSERRLDALHHVSSLLERDDDPNSLIRLVLAEILALPGVEAATMVSEGMQPNVLVSSGAEPEADRQLSAMLSGPPYSLGHFAMNVLSVPVSSGGRTYGLLAVRFAEHAPAEDDTALISHIAHELATALESAEMRRQEQEALQRYAKGVTLAQEQERRRIARDLHDDTAQSLVTLARGLSRISRASSDGYSDALAEMRGVALNALESIRRTSWALRPPVLEDLGLVPALESLTRRQPPGTPRPELHVIGDPKPLPPDLELTAFRLAQESLSNVQRHAGASAVVVRVEFAPDHIRLEVKDDGVGFDVHAVDRSGHFGLLGMQERAQLVGGTLRVTSALGQGTSVDFASPIRLDSAPQTMRGGETPEQTAHHGLDP